MHDKKISKQANKYINKQKAIFNYLYLFWLIVQMQLNWLYLDM